MEFKTIEDEAMMVIERNKALYGMFNVALTMGHEMSKEQLITIIKELDWAVLQNVNVETYNKITIETLQELKENDNF